MIRTGDTIENPVTGESVTFLRTSRDTDGESVYIEVTVQPGGSVAATHVHPYQTETFEILAGVAGFQVGSERLTAGAGEMVTVEPGAAHRFWNAGDDELVFRCEVRPALRFEQLLETMYALAADGKTNRRGMPNPIRLAVIAKAHFDDVRLPFPPVPLQKAGLALSAPLGRLLGYAPNYLPAPRIGDAMPAGA